MLLQILDYLQKEKVASNQQIARALAIDPMALEPMLECWVKRGVIVTADGKKACKTACFKCKTKPLIYYQIKTN